MKKFMLALMAVAALLAVSCNKDGNKDKGDGGKKSAEIRVSFYCNPQFKAPALWAWCKDGELNNGAEWPNGLLSDGMESGWYIFKLDEKYIDREEFGFLIVQTEGEVLQTVDVKDITIHNGDVRYYLVDVPESGDNYSIEDRTD